MCFPRVYGVCVCVLSGGSIVVLASAHRFLCRGRSANARGVLAVAYLMYISDLEGESAGRCYAILIIVSAVLRPYIGIQCEALFTAPG